MGARCGSQSKDRSSQASAPYGHCASLTLPPPRSGLGTDSRAVAGIEADSNAIARNSPGRCTGGGLGDAATARGGL
eukprot:357713-Chlamydomonas_euryale.AAC.5